MSNSGSAPVELSCIQKDGPVVTVQVSLGWVYLFMGIVIGSAVIPITLSLFWRRLTGVAMTAGATSGAVLGLLSWLIVSSLHPAGLADFFTSTGTSGSAAQPGRPSLLWPDSNRLRDN